MIQAGGKILCCEIHKLINCIWNTDEFPHQWKQSSIISVYNKGDEMFYLLLESVLLAFDQYPVIYTFFNFGRAISNSRGLDSGTKGSGVCASA
jgi:hypothetical protein